MSNVEGKKISMQDIKLVENRIERCLQLYMNKKEVVNTLIKQDNIDPRFTDIVWRRLEEQNPEFFSAYYLKLLVKEQINEFNRLLSEQVDLMCQTGSIGLASVPTSNGSHISPSLPRDSFQPIFDKFAIVNMFCTFIRTSIALDHQIQRICIKYYKSILLTRGNVDIKSAAYHG